MINIEKEKCIISGSLLEIATDVTMALATVYDTVERQMGEDKAKSLLVAIGRSAVDKDAIDESVISKHTYVIPK